MKLDAIIKEYSKKIVDSLEELYIEAYQAGAKSVATKAEKQSLYDEAYDYFNEQRDWLESHFVDTDSSVLHDKLSTAIAQGQSFPKFWENVRDSGMFSRMRGERIFRTETNRAYSEGTIRQYMKEGVKKVNILLGPTPCPICTDIAMAGPHNTKDVEGMLPIHPNSIISGSAPLYTTKGYKAIKNAKIGDEVLTIDGTFKKITAVSIVDALTNDSVTLSLGKFGHTRQQKISLTPEHRVWTKRGWIDAKDLTIDDCVLQYYKPCSVCGKSHIVWKNHCSIECQRIDNSEYLQKCGTKALKNLGSEFRKLHNKKINKRLKAEGRLGFQNKCVQEKAQKTLEPKRQEMILNARRACAKNRANETYIEKKVRLYLQKINVNFEQEYHIFDEKTNRSFFLDFALPEKKIDIECDGKYWHNKEDDTIRDGILKRLGWTVLRLSGHNINREFFRCKRQIENVLMNHSDKFVSKWIKLLRVTHNRVPVVKSLYDITVEDNETFIINSIVVHNCSCVFVNAAVSKPPEIILPTE